MSKAQSQIIRSSRLAAIETLPNEMRDHALVDWQTVANLLGAKDIEHCREVVTKAGVPLVEISERRRLPRWGSLREFLNSRERAELCPERA